MSRNRVASPTQVEAIARANHAEDRWTHTRVAASVTVGDAVYWWVAA
jgi:hypothetical protein